MVQLSILQTHCEIITERPEHLGKMGNNNNVNWGVANFERAYQPLHPGTEILVMPQFSYMPDQILGKNEKWPKFDISLGSFPSKI